jgi:hypothetical protein
VALLSALAHHNHPESQQIFAALLHAANGLDDDRAKLYYDLVDLFPPEDHRRRWEDLLTVTYEYQSNFARRYIAEGEAQGEAKLILVVLDARGIEVPTEARERIMACSDTIQLLEWGHRAASITSIDELFDE